MIDFSNVCHRDVGNSGNSKKLRHTSSVKLTARGLGAKPNAGIMMSDSAMIFIDVFMQSVALAVRVVALIVPVVD